MTLPVAEPAIRIRTGNQLVAEAAVHSGCRFFAGYPITPASGIYKAMIDRLPAVRGVAVNAPDEISALAYCVGASARGVKAMTATSGPGWALMVETVQFALMTELPVVIVVVQRLGPSTGGATQGAQGDVWFTEYCSSGGYTIPVFAPSTARECFELTTAAFHWSERLRTPVVVLSDKDVGMTAEDVDESTLRADPPFTRPPWRPGPAGAHRPYGFARSADVPAFAPIGGPVKVAMTGSAHDQRGTLRKNAPEVLAVLRHLEDKIEANREALARLVVEGDEDADTLVLSFGVTARAARDAVRLARARGSRVRFANVQTLFPVPERRLVELARGAARIVVAEENLTGQYRRVIGPLFEGARVVGVNAIGRLISPHDVLTAIVTP